MAKNSCDPIIHFELLRLPAINQFAIDACREVDGVGPRPQQMKIAELEGVKSRNVMVSAGSGEALRVAALAFGQNGGRVVAATPTFAFLPTYAGGYEKTIESS